MNQKTLSIISYLTIIGWLVAYFSSKVEKKSPMLVTHLQQSLGLSVIFFMVSIIISIIVSIIPALSVLSFINLLYFAFIIIGIINAANEKNSSLPIIGSMFEGRFSFIN